MKTVYKYEFQINDYVQWVMPYGAKPLHVEVQHDSLCLWALVDTDRPERTYRFRVAGTGHPIEEEKLQHISTFMMHGGSLVFHMFLLGEL